MRQHLSRFLAPLIFEGDDEKYRTAHILSTILKINLVGWLLVILVLPFFSSPWYSYLAISTLIAVAGFSLFALRRGHVEPAAHLFLGLIWFAVTVLVIITGGITSLQTAAFMLVILTAGLLGGVGAATLYTALGLLSLLVIYLVEKNGFHATLLAIPPSGAWIVISTNLIAFSGLLYLLISRMEGAMHRANQYAHALEEERSHLEDRVALRTQALEIARQEAEVAHQSLAVQLWLSAGQLRVSEAARGEPDLPTLAGRVTQAICQHLDSPVGAIFARISANSHSPDQQILHFAGGHACFFDPSGPICQFAPGEGLVGQVALDQQPIIIQDEAAGNLVVVSGLGSTQPRHVVVWPCLYGDQTLAVLELGLWEPISDIQLQFLERSAETIAIAVHTIRSRAKINELLSETQAQANQLRVREEELRAFNEELEAQSDARQAERKTKPGKEHKKRGES